MIGRSELEEMTREGDERREAVVFDLCSGKGLAAAVCAEAVTDVREVVMIDADDRMVLRHLESEPLVRFRRMDVYEEGVGAMMASARESARASCSSACICGELSRRAVEYSANTVTFWCYRRVARMRRCERGNDGTERSVRVTATEETRRRLVRLVD